MVIGQYGEVLIGWLGRVLRRAMSLGGGMREEGWGGRREEGGPGGVRAGRPPPAPLPPPSLPPPLLRRQRSGSAGCRLGSVGWLAQYQGRLLTAGGLARRLARGGWERGVLRGGQGASKTTIKHCWTPPPWPPLRQTTAADSAEQQIPTPVQSQSHT